MVYMIFSMTNTLSLNQDPTWCIPKKAMQLRKLRRMCYTRAAGAM